MDIDLNEGNEEDTVVIPRRESVLIRFSVDNVRIWMLHSRFLVHLQSGMAMVLQVGGKPA